MLATGLRQKNQLDPIPIGNHSHKDLLMKYDSNKYIEVPVFTVSEAARFIGVGKKVIYQLIEFDEIRAIREHGKVMIDRSSLEAFHNSGKRP